MTELIDLYPTVSSLCRLPVSQRLQGKDISQMLDDPSHSVRTAAFSVAPMQKGFLLRSEKWAYIQYGEDGKKGAELFDMKNDPQQITNLVDDPEYREVAQSFKTAVTEKLKSVRDNDLGLSYPSNR